MPNALAGVLRPVGGQLAQMMRGLGRKRLIDQLRFSGRQLAAGHLNRRTILLLLGCLFAVYMLATSVYVGRARSQQHNREQEMLDALKRLPQHMLNADGPSCDDLLHIPKVALLFLTPGRLPHERLWREWLQDAAGVLPKASVAQYAGSALGLQRTKMREVQAACIPPVVDSNSTILQQQFLYTVYVHTHPAFRGYRNTSLFHGHVIPDRIIAKRGQHSLTIAERLLLIEAIKNPLNGFFVLLSETTIPIYPAALLWQQLFAENVTRVDACNYRWEQEGNLERWNDKLETPNFKKEHWRKTSQWFSMTRPHAELVIADREVDEAFTKYCFPWFDHVRQRNVTCSSNEHYMAILLAMHGLAHETSCYGGGHTYVDWSKMNSEGRPRSFRKKEIDAALFQHARRRPSQPQEGVDAALAAAAASFVHVGRLPLRASPWAQLRAPRYPPLHSNSSLFARKFPAETSKVVRETVREFIHLPVD